MNSRWVSVVVFSLAIPCCLSQQPAKNSEAAAVGMHGPVHTVQTEYFDYQSDSEESPTISRFAVYDPKGYLLEEYFYQPSGTLHSHTKYTRNEWRIFKTETTSVVPSETRTFVYNFNSNGVVIGTDTYDGGGVLIQKTKNDFSSNAGGDNVSNSLTTNVDGTVSSDKTVETTDSKSGISRQTTTRDENPYSDWLIQRDATGTPVSDALKFADGSFNQREVKPDGTTVEHRYWAPSKTHTYQTTDPHGNITEVIDASQSSYTRTTFRYDEQGRRIDLINYDRSGKRVGEETDKYRDDEYGNWIEQKELVWNPEMGSKPPKLATVTRRTITYY